MSDNNRVRNFFEMIIQKSLILNSFLERCRSNCKRQFTKYLENNFATLDYRRTSAFFNTRSKAFCNAQSSSP